MDAGTRRHQDCKLKQGLKSEVGEGVGCGGGVGE